MFTSSPDYAKNQLRLVFTLLLLFTTQIVFTHGTVTYPISRVYNCYLENPESPTSPPCIDAVLSHGSQPLYDWNEINQGMVGGNHQLFVPDGNLASGGRPDKYGGMDQIRGDWVATDVTPGPLTILWTNTAPHATAYFDVYITTADWTPDMELSWDKLELLVRTPPSEASSTDEIPVTLPFRTGRHVIYSVWQRADSPEAFYSTSDVDFGELTLPINLQAFDGEAQSKQNLLSWSTSSEENTNWHILQRSSDGVNGWTEVGRTRAAGTSNAEEAYILSDQNPYSITFYRLVSQDFDGSEQISNIIRVKREAAEMGILTAYPNPVGSDLTLSFATTERSTFDISLYDVAGRRILHQAGVAGEQSFSIQVNMATVRPGLYWLKCVSADGQIQTKRIVKQ